MSDTPHLRRHGNATQLVVDGSPFVVLGGQVHNSSSSSLEYMEHVWERVCELNCNTAITPVYWELVEPRDCCPLAEEAFGRAVPKRLMQHMQQNEGRLRPELLDLWRSAGHRPAGTWAEVFGRGADEVFMAWHVASYVQKVAEAGLAEYPLPLYANVWLVQSEGQEPGGYPSGGPVSRMMDVWHCAAKDIFTLAPDIYVPWFAEVCADYTRDDNPLLIPEVSRDHAVGAKCFYAVGKHDALCFAPFGIDSVDSPRPVVVEGPLADAPVKRPLQGVGRILARTYEILRGMMPLVAEHQGTGSMTAFLQSKNHVDVFAFGGYRLRVEYAEAAGPGRVPGGGIVIAEPDGAFVIAGLRARVDFLPLEGAAANVEYLALDEGEYRDGAWVQLRRLNGDEQAIRLGDEPCVRRARIHSFD
jgi:hypothetical protein